MDWMLMPLKRYADFSGRSRRKEYWMWALFQIILFTVIVITGVIIYGFIDPDAGEFGGGTPGILMALLALAFLIPNISVTVRRFHDQNRSGWWFLLNFIPYIGSIIVLVFMCLEGTRGPNRFGPDPKRGDDDEVFA